MNQKFKEIRLEKGLTQQELAGKLGLSVRTIACIEKGTTAIKANHLVWYAEYYSVSADYLLGLSKRKFIINKK